MKKISIICTIHRYGGIDLMFAGLEHQTFPKEDYELILCDKLYDIRHETIKNWAQENNINVTHFKPKNQSNYHVHSSVLNECLEKVTGEYTIVIGDYTFMMPHWLEIHHTYNQAGYCLSGPQRIYGLPKLCVDLRQPISTFNENFNTDMFKLLPQFQMDPKLQLPNGSLIDHRYCYNRNESFPTAAAKKIGGWDESFDNRVGQSNLEFYLRLIHECNLQIASDGRAEIYRIMSYPIPPFTEFLAAETDATINTIKYNKLCKKYNVGE